MTETRLRVDPGNAGQAEAWDGREGEFWASNADRFDRAVAAHHRVLMDAAAIGPADRVLDLGCGAGETTCDAARRAREGDALGVDLSGALVEVARRRATAADVRNASFLRADAQVHEFGDALFDTVISRTGTMFFGDPVAAFTNVARATAKGGRLAMVTWQEASENEWFLAFTDALAAGRDMPTPPSGAPGPFALAQPSRVAQVLTDAGFRQVTCDPHTLPMWFGNDVDEAVEFVLGTTGWMLEGLDDGDRARALAALRRSIADHHGDDGVVYRSGVWLTTATR